MTVSLQKGLLLPESNIHRMVSTCDGPGSHYGNDDDGDGESGDHQIHSYLDQFHVLFAMQRRGKRDKIAMIPMHTHTNTQAVHYNIKM